MASWKRSFYATWTAQLTAVMGFTLVIPMLTFYTRELGAIGSNAETAKWAGIMRAAGPISLAISAPIWGAVADRYGRKLMLLRAMFGGAVVMALMGCCQNMWQLAVCRVLQGALSGTVPASIALAAGATPRHRSGHTLGMMQVAVLLGACIGTGSGGMIADYFDSYRIVYFCSAAIVLSGGILVLFGVKEQFTPPVPIEGPGGNRFGHVFATTGFIVAVAILFIVRVASSTMAPAFPLFVEVIKGNKEGINTLVGTITSVSFITGAASAWLMGYFGHKWGYKWPLVVLLALAAVVAASHLAVGKVIHFYYLRLALGLATGGMTPAVNAIIRHAMGDHNLGKAFGLVTSLGALGVALGQLTGGYIAACFELQTPFVLMAALMALAAVTVAWRIQPVQQ